MTIGQCVERVSENWKFCATDIIVRFPTSICNRLGWSTAKRRGATRESFPVSESFVEQSNKSDTVRVESRSICSRKSACRSWSSVTHEEAAITITKRKQDYPAPNASSYLLFSQCLVSSALLPHFSHKIYVRKYLFNTGIRSIRLLSILLLHTFVIYFLSNIQSTSLNFYTA